ncbi:uncharacterized protein [Antedon mediterranea]|uniref:uncharacterized protein isoform X2 n=1 Tax=Antedon mediterranea TaxID=105859 RepID=UPI003AF6EDE6
MRKSVNMMSKCLVFLVLSIQFHKVINGQEIKSPLSPEKQSIPRPAPAASNSIQHAAKNTRVVDPRVKQILEQLKQLRKNAPAKGGGVRRQKEDRRRQRLYDRKVSVMGGKQQRVQPPQPYPQSRIASPDRLKTVHSSGIMKDVGPRPILSKIKNVRDLEAKRMMEKIEAEEIRKDCNNMKLLIGILIGIASTVAVAGIFSVAKYFLCMPTTNTEYNDGIGKAKWISDRKPTLPKRNPREAKPNKYVIIKRTRKEEDDLYDKIVDDSDGIYIDDDEVEAIREEHEIANLRPAPPIPKTAQRSHSRSEDIYETPMRPKDNEYLEFE